MFAWGRDSVDKDTMDLKKCCMGMRLVVQRTRAWSRTQLRLQEQLPTDQACSCSSTLTRLEAAQLE